MNGLKMIYEPTGEPVRGIVWCSGGNSSGMGLHNDPNRGVTQIIEKVYADRECPGIEGAKKVGYDAEVVSTKGYDLKNPVERAAYFDMFLDKVLENPPEVIVLSGFKLLISKKVFDKLKEEEIEMMNVHPGNLGKGRYVGTNNILDAGKMKTADITSMIKSGKLERAYIGNHAVYDAIMNGETELMSTIHFVTPGTDAGPIITRKPRTTKVDQKAIQGLKALSDFDGIKKYSDEFQEFMKTECDVPAFCNAFKILYNNKIEINPETETLYFNEIEQPYGGVLMKAE